MAVHHWTLPLHSAKSVSRRRLLMTADRCSGVVFWASAATESGPGVGQARSGSGVWGGPRRVCVLAAETALLVGGGSEENDAKVLVDTPRAKKVLVRSDSMAKDGGKCGRACTRKKNWGRRWAVFVQHGCDAANLAQRLGPGVPPLNGITKSMPLSYSFPIVLDAMGRLSSPQSSSCRALVEEPCILRTDDAGIKSRSPARCSSSPRPRPTSAARSWARRPRPSWG